MRSLLKDPGVQVQRGNIYGNTRSQLVVDFFLFYFFFYQEGYISEMLVQVKLT